MMASIRPPGFRGAVVFLSAIGIAACILAEGCGRSQGEKGAAVDGEPSGSPPVSPPEPPAPSPGEEEAAAEASRWAAKLGDPDYKVRVQATDALIRIGPPAVGSLVLALQSEDTAVRTNAANVLKMLAGREDTRDLLRAQAVDGLIASLSIPDLYSRTMAAQALGAIGDWKAAPPLIEMLDEPQSRVRASAAEALETMTGERFGADAKAWREWYEKNR